MKFTQSKITLPAIVAVSVLGGAATAYAQDINTIIAEALAGKSEEEVKAIVAAAFGGVSAESKFVFNTTSSSTAYQMRTAPEAPSDTCSPAARCLTVSEGLLRA